MLKEAKHLSAWSLIHFRMRFVQLGTGFRADLASKNTYRAACIAALRYFDDGRRMPLHTLDLDLMQGPGVKQLFKAIICENAT